MGTVAPLHATRLGETAIGTLKLIEQIRLLMADYKRRLRDDHSKIYSQDLLNNLFRHPYTRIEFVQHEIGVTRQTAARHLDQLPLLGDCWSSIRKDAANYYINTPLVELLTSGEQLDREQR